MLQLHIPQLPLQGYDKAGSRSAFWQCPETIRFTYSIQHSQGLLSLRMRKRNCGTGPREVCCRLLITSSALGSASTVKEKKKTMKKCCKHSLFCYSYNNLLCWIKPMMGNFFKSNRKRIEFQSTLTSCTLINPHHYCYCMCLPLLCL